MAVGKKKLTELPQSEVAIGRAIDGYFKRCDGVQARDSDGNLMFNKNGAPSYERVPVSPTTTGLALAVGLQSRQAVLQFSADEMGYSLIRRGVARVEEYAERQLLESGTAGVKFFLARSFSGWGEDDEEGGASPLAGLSEEKLAEYVEKLTVCGQEGCDGQGDVTRGT